MRCNLKIHKSGYGIVVAVCIGALALYCASTRTAVHAANNNDASTQAKIASAISAGPEDITRDATIAVMDAKGNMTVIRKGTNEWTCMPGDPNSIADPPMCEDKASMQWDYAFRRHLPKPLNTVPGITYMLAGAEQRSDSDPYDKTSPPIKIGPHWMIMWPFDPKLTGLPTKHKPAGAYIMWAGSPYAHVHVMGRP
jgi:hypothetical protein